MNSINFSQPNGFPLEAEGLDFMQSSYIQGLTALAKLAGQDNVILTGLNPSGTTVSDGWVLFQGELFFFKGGLKSATFVIEQVITSLNNANGNTVPRYYSRSLKFGSGTTTYPFDMLKRVQSLSSIEEKLSLCLFEPSVIISGCLIVSVGSGQVNISSGVVKINDSFYYMPSYQGANPIYINQEGQWSQNNQSPNDISFEPYTSCYLADVFKRSTTPLGEIIMSAALLSDFDSSGLGIFSKKGWALCNGNNGTFDLRGRTIMGYDERVNDPANGIWDSLYNNLGNVGGEKAHQISIDEMPRHNHQDIGNSSGAKYQDTNSGEFGLVRKSLSGETVTVRSPDSTGSGVEPDLTISPVIIPFQGDNKKHENRPPFLVVAFLQRILI